MKGDNQGAEELAVTKGLDHLPHPPLTPRSGGLLVDWGTPELSAIVSGAWWNERLKQKLK